MSDLLKSNQVEDTSSHVIVESYKDYQNQNLEGKNRSSSNKHPVGTNGSEVHLKISLCAQENYLLTKEENNNLELQTEYPKPKILHFICPVCRLSLASHFSTVTHLRLHGRPLCQRCLVVFNSPASLERHRRRGNCQPPDTCPQKLVQSEASVAPTRAASTRVRYKPKYLCDHIA